MAVLPQARIDQIEFCEDHVPTWEISPTNIGLTAVKVAALEALTATARTKYHLALQARDASKAATVEYHEATRAMRDKAATMIADIKAYAEQQASPETVYAAARIDPPAPPTPATAPGVPNMIQVGLEPSGAVTLSWDCENAAASSGAFFNIARKLPGQTSFVPVGGAPGSTAQSRRMSFTDFTVPTSAAQTGAQYIIQGRRGNLFGDPTEAITVQFGVEGGGGGMFAINGVSQPIKMAA